MNYRIIIFAKAPVAGFAKTRLIPALGPDAAALLARRMLLHAVAAARSAGVHGVELCMTPPPEDVHWKGLPLPPTLICSDQGTGDLGTRLARAAQRTLAAGEAVLLMGTDCPGLDAAAIGAAADALATHDSVMIPTADGGYALLGLKAYHPSLFDGIRWSTSEVAEETLKRLETLGWSVSQRPMLHDIDRADDLRWLPEAWLENESFR